MDAKTSNDIERDFIKCLRIYTEHDRLIFILDKKEYFDIRTEVPKTEEKFRMGLNISEITVLTVEEKNIVTDKFFRALQYFSISDDFRVLTIQHTDTEKKLGVCIWIQIDHPKENEGEY